ncbi:MAG: NUDIX hydrolase, partial [Oligoflexia bacterium]|nr:NUDIX hydrolase [Oligoflexia bacterium]
VLAIDNSNRVVVERQYRRGVDQFVYELPAGWVNPNESPVDAAKRELLEETGYVGKGDKFFEIYPQPGFSSMKAFVVILNIDNKRDIESRDFDETLSYELVEIQKVKTMVISEDIRDMGFLSALTIYEASLEE